MNRQVNPAIISERMAVRKEAERWYTHSPWNGPATPKTNQCPGHVCGHGCGVLKCGLCEVQTPAKEPHSSIDITIALACVSC